MAQTFVSRPTTIEAVQWDGTNEAFHDIYAMVGVGKVYTHPDGLQLRAGADGVHGWVTVPVGHWIVRQPGDSSDIWPVEDAYFQAKYLPALFS